MTFYKITNDDGYVCAVGMNYTDEEIGTRITEMEYIHISERFARAHTEYGKKAVMIDGTYAIQFMDVEVPDDEEIPDNIAMKIIAGKM